MLAQFVAGLGLAVSPADFNSRFVSCGSGWPADVRFAAGRGTLVNLLSLYKVKVRTMTLVAARLRSVS